MMKRDKGHELEDAVIVALNLFHVELDVPLTENRGNLLSLGFITVDLKPEH